MRHAINRFSIAVFITVALCNCDKSEKHKPKPTLPELTTLELTEITESSAKSGGMIISDGGGTISAAGVCWSVNPNPTISGSKTTDNIIALSFSSTIVGLLPQTEYYVRAYATNDVGTEYGNEIGFISGIADASGNTYQIIKIGTQVWMKENLRTSKYNNGDNIPEVTSDPDWGGQTNGAWCYFDNSASKNLPYGKLYNFYAIADPRNVCPNGWHVPTDGEWTTLENDLGGAGVAGGKLKEVGTVHWTSPNIGANNSSGFTGIGGGNRRGATNAVFEVFGILGRHWTSTEINSSEAIGRDLVNDGVNVGSNQFNKTYGFSVRCVKD